LTAQGQLRTYIDTPTVVPASSMENNCPGQPVVAVVVPAAGTEPDAYELREHVRKVLRGSRTPDRVVFRDVLPTNATGKLLRRKIIEDLRDVNADK